MPRINLCDRGGSGDCAPRPAAQGQAAKLARESATAARATVRIIGPTGDDEVGIEWIKIMGEAAAAICGGGEARGGGLRFRRVVRASGAPPRRSPARWAARGEVEGRGA